MSTVSHIFVAPQRGAPMRSLSAVQALADCGLDGDRYGILKNRKSPDYQLTLIELEQIEAFTVRSGRPMAPDQPRRNLVTVGVNLNALCGQRFLVGDVELEGLELCEPCGLLAKRTHRDVLKFLVHKGGLRARIRSGGLIRVGDSIAAMPRSAAG
jgi:MOSC domain-containing protein YiiM